MDTFYDVVMERFHADYEYAVLVFHDRYDIPAKAADKAYIIKASAMYREGRKSCLTRRGICSRM